MEVKKIKLQVLTDCSYSDLQILLARVHINKTADSCTNVALREFTSLALSKKEIH